MSPWFEIALIVFLAISLIALIGIRDAVESIGKQTKEATERLDGCAKHTGIKKSRYGS